MIDTLGLAWKPHFYERKRWGKVFTIRRDRLGPTYQLLDEAKATATLTRWFDRVLGRYGYVSGRADVKVSLSRLHQNIYLLSAVVNVFDDFREEHRDVLASLVDNPGSSIVQIMVPAELP